MKMARYSTLVSGLIFLSIALYGIVRDIPALYVVCLVLGFMFSLQGIAKLKR
jgi:uncharacterized membrane protein HdeD (DUF308 family)